MRATAAKSRRCQSPVYHYVISWHRDENPTEAMMRQVADTTCEDLGLGDHQRLYIAHADTEHRHVHIVVNRVNPDTLTAWNPRQDWVRIEQSLRRQSDILGLDYVPGRHNDPERFTDSPRRERAAEFQCDRRLGKSSSHGLWSKPRIQRERDALAAMFETAASWKELDRALQAKDMVLKTKGQGMVLDDAGGSVKVSSLGKSVRIKDLAKKFGETRASYSEREKTALLAQLPETSTDVSTSVDTAFAFYRFGLIGRHELDRVIAVRDRAVGDVMAARPLHERVQAEITKALQHRKTLRKRAPDKLPGRHKRDLERD
jgi:Relaxase/Mobilisation nuclease domain